MSVDDPFDQLRKLSELKEDGIVDADEFRRMKAELVSRVSGSPKGVPRDTPAALPAGGSAALDPSHPPQPLISFDGERITQDDVAESGNRVLACQVECQELTVQQDNRRRRLRRYRRQLRHFGFLIRARGLFRDVVMGRFAPVALSPFVGTLIGVVIFGTVGGSMLIGGALGAAALMLAAVHVFVIPDDILVVNKIAAAGGERDELESLLKSDEPAVLSAKARLEEMRREHEGLVKRFQGRRNQLLTAEWRTFRGPQFVQFLKGVFECLGYKATCTGGCGDQGVDLVAEKGDSRLAIQAKGYVSSVGNEAVQQVHAGQTFHKCNRCCVITNSVFTPSARRLAESVNCLLIDGSQINSLIFGKLEL